MNEKEALQRARERAVKAVEEFKKSSRMPDIISVAKKEAEERELQELIQPVIDATTLPAVIKQLNKRGLRYNSLGLAVLAIIASSLYPEVANAVGMRDQKESIEKIPLRLRAHIQKLIDEEKGRPLSEKTLPAGPNEFFDMIDR
jgi:hypothetical protein